MTIRQLTNVGMTRTNRQHVDYLQNKGRDYISMSYSLSFVSVSGICYKSENISDDTISGDRFSVNDSKFKGIEYFPYKGLRSPEIKNFGVKERLSLIEL